MSRKRIVVVCPGRGSYTAETLGYLNPYKKLVGDFVQDLDERRARLSDPTISELDGAEKFKMSLHTKGEHASVLIYACAYADFMGIDQNRYEVVAITGNSMGWYLAMAMAQSLDRSSAFEVIQTMGGQMRDRLIGGQVIYSLVNEDWQLDVDKVKHVDEVVNRLRGNGHGVFDSIYLGGYRVLGADKAALPLLLKELKPDDKYPFQLVNHGAFHTPLLKETSDLAFRQLSENLFQKPQIPLIDGRGHIWKPWSTAIDEIYQYTLGHQVTDAYDFTTAITVALKEYCPDHIVLLGPGNSLGGAMGQILIENQWRGVRNKAEFIEMQKTDPFLVSMGLPDQRGVVGRAL